MTAGSVTRSAVGAENSLSVNPCPSTKLVDDAQRITDIEVGRRKRGIGGADDVDPLGRASGSGNDLVLPLEAERTGNAIGVRNRCGVRGEHLPDLSGAVDDDRSGGNVVGAADRHIGELQPLDIAQPCRCRRCRRCR